MNYFNEYFIPVLILHILFAIFILFTPFFGNNYLMMLHIIVLPFVVSHWLINDQSCALTLMELKIRECIYDNAKKEDCFFSSLVEPVYSLNKIFSNDVQMLYFITSFLWLASVSKLFYKFSNNEINKLSDLFKS